MTTKKQSVSVRIAIWESDKDKLSEVRRLVFIEEQKVPEQLEWDGEDESSIHYLAEIDDKIVAVARLKPDGQLGRMAVLQTIKIYYKKLEQQKKYLSPRTSFSDTLLQKTWLHGM